MLAEERLLVKGGCSLRDTGCATWFGRADEGVSGDKGLLCCREDNPKVSVLAPAEGTLNQCHVDGEETVGVLDRSVGRFSQMLGEGWGWEAVGDGVDRLGVRHL